MITLSFPRYGAPDFAAFWESDEPGDLDAAFLQSFREAVTPGSVVVVELLKNSVHNGADETLTVVRCGRLWSFEYN